MFERWPHVISAIQEAPPLDSINVAMSESCMTLVVNGMQLTSAFDREREAEHQAGRIVEDAEEVWVYGAGLGDLPKAFLKRPAIKKVNVVLMNLSISRAAMEFGQADWTGDPRIEVHLGESQETVQRPMVVSPVEMRMADEECHRLRDRIAMLLNMEFNDMAMAARRNWELGQFEKNKANIEKDGRVTRLFGCARPRNKAIVIAGGPTLARYYGWIKLQKNTFIIAAATALRSLQAADVMPDIVMEADPLPATLKHFEGVDLDRFNKTTLVYIPTAQPQIIEQWKGPRAMATIHADCEGDLFSGGSVLHSCVDLAVKMGCRKICMVGADLCYPGGASHVAGAASPYSVKEPWRAWARNGNGERVTTDEALTQYRSRLEDYIAENGGKNRFSKVGRDGLPVEGAEWLDV
jgi:hypothetical protein